MQRDCRRSNAKEERGKDEKSALKHCLGNGGIACVGPDHAAAAYERATGAAAADHYNHNDHDGRNGDNYGVHARERNRAEGKQRTHPLSLRQNGHLRDTKRKGSG